MLAQRVGQRDAVRVAPLPQLVLVVHRAGGGRGAEQRAAEARALLVGPVDEPHGRPPAARPPRSGAAPRRRPRRSGSRRASRRSAPSRCGRRSAPRARRRRAASTTGCRPRRPRTRAAARRACRAATRAPAPRCPSTRRAARRSRRRSARAARVSSATVRLGIEHGAIVNRPRECGKNTRWRRWPRPARRAPRTGLRCDARPRASRSFVVVLAALWGLWEGYRWLWIHEGWTWPFVVDDTTMPHLHDIFAALWGSASPGGVGPRLITILVQGRALHREGGGGRLRASARSSASRSASLLAHFRLLQRGLAAVHRRLADGPDPRVAPMVVVWANPKLPSGLQGLGRGRRDRRVPDLLPGDGQHAPRPAVGRPARARADALATRPATGGSSGSSAFPAALPYLFAALKVAATASVVGAIIGELPSSIQDGLGGAILNFNQYYSTRAARALGDEHHRRGARDLVLPRHRARREARRAPRAGEPRMSVVEIAGRDEAVRRRRPRSRASTSRSSEASSSR